MTRPRQSKSFLLKIFPLLLVLLFATTASAASAVLGIDFGTEYLKAAIAKPGSPIEIVLTKDSKRKETAALAFKPSRAQIGDDSAFPERLYGGDALALSARFPTDVYLNLKSVLGLSSKSNEVKNYLSRFPGLQAIDIPRADTSVVGSTLGLKSQSFRKDGSFMIEELLAMEFKNIKANAEATAGKNIHVSEVVITHPAFYTAEEKRAIELAAQMAGLKVLGLISDGLAVGLNYATHRTFDSVTDGAKPEYHIVYDMGAGSTTATVLKFQGKTVKGSGKRNTTYQEVQVIGFGSDKTLGGDALNDLIVDDMVNKFIEMPRIKQFKLPAINVKKHGKTMARLWKDAEKVRQVLSANSVSHSTQEGLFYEDVTFKYKLTRDEFESLVQDHAARVSAPITHALLMADLRLEDINSVILHGGMIRTPFVQKQLEKAAGGADKIKTNVNADEAAVMGAAFKAASLSPSFRVKDIRSVDVSGVPYTMSWTVDGKTKEQKVFVPTSQVGVEKQITLKTLQDTTLDFKQDSDGVVSNVISISLTNLTKSTAELKDKYGCASNNITAVFNVRLSLVNGIPELVSGSVSCKAEKGKDDSVLGKAKGLFGFGKKDQEPLKEGDAKLDETETPLPVDDPTSSGTIVSEASATDSSSVASSKSTSASTATKAKPALITIQLAQEQQLKGLNQPKIKELPTITQRLAAFDASDRTSVLRAESLNVLEAFTYRARDYLEDESFVAVSTDKVRNELEKQLSAVSDWLYSDGIDAKLEEFKQRLKELKSLVEPVLKRKDEGTKRQAAVDAVNEGLLSVQSMIDMVKGQLEKSAADAATKASSAASSVAGKASSAASSVISSVTGGDNLDDDPYETATKPVAAVEDIEDLITKPYEYTEEDLTSLSKGYDTAKKWLEEKLALQEKLHPYEDPAVLVADLQAQASKLQNSVTDMIMKQIKMSQPKAKKSKSSKPAKPKTKKSKSTSAGESSSVTESSTVVESASATATPDRNRDEL